MVTGEFMFKNLLYVDACVRGEDSRTRRLAQAWLAKYAAGSRIIVRDLPQCSLQPLTHEQLAKREKLIRDGNWADDMFRYARELAEAETLVIAAPYWDLSFPSVLKLYLEQISVCGITFRYDESGRPAGLTGIRKLIYITTSGGYIGKANFGFDYVKGLFGQLFGISDIVFLSAEGLDIYGNDPEEILAEAVKSFS